MLKDISEDRLGGCTLGGAIAVTAYVKNAVTVVHAPQGCVHQTFSMYHAMLAESADFVMPTFLTSDLTDNDIIFGGENALNKVLDEAVLRNPEVIFVISSCVAETIGDDCASVCRSHPAAEKIIYIPTSGFLGGKAKDGENMALVEIAKKISVGEVIPDTVALIGEKNLETEIEENYREISRLLGLLGIRVLLRFCHNISVSEMEKLGKAACFIARDDRVLGAATEISALFKRPLVKSFPSGLEGEIRFLREVGAACNISSAKIEEAVAKEKEIQNRILAEFSELRGMNVFIRYEPFEGSYAVAKEVMEKLDITEDFKGKEVMLPFYLPVGVAGIEKMLYLWRREKRSGE